MEVGETKWENYANKPKIDSVVLVLELEQRQAKDIYSELNGVLSQQKENIQKSNNLKFLEQIINLIYLGLSTRIIVMFKSNSQYNDYIRCLIQSYLKSSWNVECEFATSSGDLWYLLSKNIENLDIIHIFSSEPQRVPDSVQKYLHENKASKNLKVMKTGSSMKDYSRVVTQISSEIYQNIVKNSGFKVKKAILSSSEETKTQATSKEISKIEDQSKPKTLFFYQNLSTFK